MTWLRRGPETLRKVPMRIANAAFSGVVGSFVSWLWNGIAPTPV